MAHTRIFGSWEADFAWRQENCKKCVKTGTGCDLEDALLISFFGSGDLSAEMCSRLGYNGSPDFRCKEYDAVTK
jgi:hypothetical protein